MRKTYIFKGGFEKENFFAYQLTVITEKIEDRQAYRLSQTVEEEYQKLLAEEYNMEKGGVEQWLGKISG